MPETTATIETEPQSAAFQADEYALRLLTGGHQPRRQDLRHVGGLLGPQHEPERVFARCEQLLKWAKIAMPPAQREAAAKNARKFSTAAEKVRQTNLAKIRELQAEIDRAEAAADQSERAVSQMRGAFNNLKNFLPVWLIEATQDETADLTANCRRPLLDRQSEVQQLEVLLKGSEAHASPIDWVDWLRLNFPSYLVRNDGRWEVSPQLAADRPQHEARVTELREQIAELEKRYQSGLARIEKMVDDYCESVTALEWAM